MLQIELRRRRLQQAQGIQVREQMAADAVAVDQLADPFLQLLRPEALRLDQSQGSMAVAVTPHLGGGRLGPGARLERRWGGRRQPMQAGEVVLPLGGNGGGVVAPPLVLILDEDLVDAEIAIEVHGTGKNSGHDAPGPRKSRTCQPLRATWPHAKKLDRRARPNRHSMKPTHRGRKLRGRRVPGWGNGRRGALKTL